MNFTTLKFGAAIAATATAATLMSGVPAQALSLAPGSFALQAGSNPVINISGPTTTLNFANQTFSLSNLSGALTGLTAGSNGIKVTDTVLDSTTNPNPASSLLTLTTVGVVGPITLFSHEAVTNFITGLKLGSEDVVFDLEGSDGAASFTLNNGDYSGTNLVGTLRTLSGSSVFGRATLTTLSFGSSETNIQIATVPTPALVPAALGFGAAMLRKRKGEQTEQETVGAKA